MNQPIPDQAACELIAQRVQVRMMRSALYFDQDRQDAVRYFKWWRQVRDDVEAGKANTLLGYAYSYVEQQFSKQTEPLFSLIPPCAPMPTRQGDGKKAENFNAIAASHYSKPHFQSSLGRSKKGMVIVGTRYEIDEWQYQQRKGRKWGQVPQKVEVPVLGEDGKPVMKDGKPAMMDNTVMVPAEVECYIPVHYGFHTRYPRFFDCYPEPDRPTIGTGLETDCSWFIEDVGEVAIEELAHEKYVDPADKQVKPVYDFSAMMRHYGDAAVARYEKMKSGEARDPHDPVGPVITPERWNLTDDYGREDKETVHPTEGTVDTSIGEDRDKVWLVREYTNGSITTIANGKWVVQIVKDPWHSGLMPIRVECFSVDPEFINGKGVVGPIESVLYELQDVHELSMQEFFDQVNGLIAVNPAAIVSWDDFQPRSRGKIRIRGDTDVKQNIFPIPRQPVSGEMLRMESNDRGMLELFASNFEGSPGVEGTKAGHKTYKGLVDVQANLRVRDSSVQRNALINEALRMWSMQAFFNQYLFEPIDIRVVHDDGSHSFAQFTKDDIFTDGRPFDMVIELDPAWGDTDTQRKLALFLFDRAVDYEKYRREAKDPSMRKMSLDQLMERILRKFGNRDTSGIFSFESGEMTPDAELQALMNGGTDVQCRGDLMAHIAEHTAQKESPMLQKAIQGKKADPKTAERLDLLIQQDLAKLAAFLKDPSAAVQDKVRNAVAAPSSGPLRRI